MSRAGEFAALVLVLAFMGCKKPSPPAGTRVDCKEDLDCYIGRARECLPTVVVHSGLYPLDWNNPRGEVQMTLRYEVRGGVRGRCHVSRTQLAPAWDWPDTGPPPDGDTWEVERWEYRQRVPFSTALGIHAPIMQCLYEGAEAARAMERVRNHTATLRDMEGCYPGDSRCGTLPRFVVGCAERECLLGRWVFVCDDKGQLRVCEGTRLSDNTPWKEKRCASSCGEDGREVLDCDFYWPERRRAKLLREAEEQRRRALGQPTDAGLSP
jgi:hypothetical protein